MSNPLFEKTKKPVYVVMNVIAFCVLTICVTYLTIKGFDTKWLWAFIVFWAFVGF